MYLYNFIKILTKSCQFHAFNKKVGQLEMFKYRLVFYLKLAGIFLLFATTFHTN